MSETADRAFTVEAARVGLASPEKDRCRGEKIEGSQRWEGRKEMPEAREDSGGLVRGQLVQAVTGTEEEGRREVEVFLNEESRAFEPLSM